MPICERCGMAYLDGESHECPPRTDGRIARCLVGAIGPPVMLPVAYLHLGAAEAPSSDAWVPIALGATLGSAALWGCPTTRLLRTAAILIYAPVTAWLEFLYMVGYVCGHYGRCL